MRNLLFYEENLLTRTHLDRSSQRHLSIGLLTTPAYSASHKISDTLPRQEVSGYEAEDRPHNASSSIQVVDTAFSTTPPHQDVRLPAPPATTTNRAPSKNTRRSKLSLQTATTRSSGKKTSSTAPVRSTILDDRQQTIDHLQSRVGELERELLFREREHEKEMAVREHEHEKATASIVAAAQKEVDEEREGRRRMRRVDQFIQIEAANLTEIKPRRDKQHHDEQSHTRYLQRTNETLQTRCDRLTSALDRYRRKHKELEETNQTLSDECHKIAALEYEARKKIEQVLAAASSKDNQVKELQEENHTLLNEYYTISDDLSKANHRVWALERMDEDF